MFLIGSPSDQREKTLFLCNQDLIVRPPLGRNNSPRGYWRLHVPLDWMCHLQTFSSAARGNDAWNQKHWLTVQQSCKIQIHFNICRPI